MIILSICQIDLLDHYLLKRVAKLHKAPFGGSPIFILIGTFNECAQMIRNLIEHGFIIMSELVKFDLKSLSHCSGM